ncbi:MAG: hypothetical protein ABEI98_08430 [Halorhabdus sp.]
MTRDSSPPGEGPTLDRRSVLAMGVGGLAAGLGLRAVSDPARAWHRFDVDFRAPDEVWFVVANDLQYDPPAIAHVIVENEDEITCRLVEFTPEAATTVPTLYDDAPVVKFSADEGNVLGVLAYNRAVGNADRYSRPRCVMPNEELSFDPLEDGDLQQAACVRAAVEDHWNGTVRTCWWDPLDGCQKPTVTETTLRPAEPHDGQQFGATLALNTDGTCLVVGAPGDGPRGAVYVFERGCQWHQRAKLTPPNEADVTFGRAIDVTGDGTRLIVGAPSETRDAGSAYVYGLRDAKWTLTARLRGNVDNAREGFGRAVAIDGTGSTVLVGAPADADRETDHPIPGRGYVFGTPEWERASVVRIPDEYEQFTDNYADSPDWGRTVALSESGSTALLGAPSVGFGFGEVHAFTRDAGEWEHGAMLHSGVEDQHAGYSLDLTADGTTAVVGSNVFSSGTPHLEGFVDVITETTPPWEQFGSTVLEPADGEDLDRFGRAVAIDDPGTTLLVGAPFRETANGSESGAAYLYTRGIDDTDLKTTIVEPDGSPAARFGDAVALDGDATVGCIGAPNAAFDAMRSGAVHVLEFDSPSTTRAQRSSSGH